MAIAADSNSSITAEEFLDEIGGFPFIDDSFNPTPLLTAVAARRRKADPKAFPRLIEYLYPRNAASVFAQHASSVIPHIPWTELSPEQVTQLDLSKATVVGVIPVWADLFSIPIRYRRTLEERYSMTNSLMPQTIYFGDVAFSGQIPLTETVVHEYAHVWLSLVAEIFDLQQEGAPCDLVLPSGTPGKSVRGVLLAAHFAAAAKSFYDAARLASQIESHRIGYLEHYLAGCLHATMNHPDLTAMGALLWERLNAVQNR